MGNCFIYSSKKLRNYFVPLNFSFTSRSSPWATYRHLTDICAWGLRNLNLAWWGWGIWAESVESFQLNTNMEYVKSKQWLRRKGLRGFKVWPVYRDFHFHQKNWARHLNTMFVPRGENLNKPIFKSSKSRGGMLKLQTDEIINA